ncbi:hypothetical protein ABDD95_19250 [Mucilaginibacter sp. PAMB04274]|uniref:hypothetical protein n=1 Tax=Mucilaginibacter sp. PAMB04274 TaxID=3138568 RepID=UPI0031F6C3F2
MRDKYLANFALTGKDHPGFLGELLFTGLDFFEWKYNGTQLIKVEVLQIVDCIQDYASAHSLNFNFSRNQVVDQIRIEKYKGYYKIFINDVYTAQIEWLQEEWVITAGSIGEPDLRAEVIKRINANSG